MWFQQHGVSDGSAAQLPPFLSIDFGGGLKSSSTTINPSLLSLSRIAHQCHVSLFLPGFLKSLLTHVLLQGPRFKTLRDLSWNGGPACRPFAKACIVSKTMQPGHGPPSPRSFDSDFYLPSRLCKWSHSQSIYLRLFLGLAEHGC
jgi:hypothetical protein